MSSVYQTTDMVSERELCALVVDAMGVDFEVVTVAFLGRRVVLSGLAPSYIAKARATECVRKVGYIEVDNCLRVVPGMPAAR